MPLYEYEPIDDWDCHICGGRFEVLQSPNEDALSTCPTCGMPCRRLISKVQVKVAKYHGADKAGDKGFTTYRRAEKGVWERIGGPGVDAIVGDPNDIAEVESEKKPVKKIDLDKPD